MCMTHTSVPSIESDKPAGHLSGSRQAPRLGFRAIVHPRMPKELTVFERLRALAHEATKFSVIGGIGLVIDIGLFNLLRYAGDPGCWRTSR